MYGKLIQTLRRKQMMSRAELGRRAGLSRQTIYNIETGRKDRNGKHDVKADTLLSIATALNVDVRELFKGARA